MKSGFDQQFQLVVQTASRKHGVVGTGIGPGEKLDAGAMHIPNQLLIAIEQHADASDPSVELLLGQILHVRHAASAGFIQQEAVEQGERGRVPGGVLHECFEQRRGLGFVIGIEQALRIGKSEPSPRSKPEMPGSFMVKMRWLRNSASRVEHASRMLIRCSSLRCPASDASAGLTASGT